MADYDVSPKNVNFPMIGAPQKRYEARAKVTGETRYAADEPLNGALYAELVTTQIPRGRITGVDTDAAKAVPGFKLALTYENVKAVPTAGAFPQGPMQSSFYPLSGPEVRYAGQIVGMVVADTIEGAREAAQRVTVSVQPAANAVAGLHIGDVPKAEPVPSQAPISVGDFEATLNDADGAIDATYTSPVQHANPMELYFTSAVWDNGHLTAYVPSQWVSATRGVLAQTFGLPTEKVRVVSAFVGGGFGSKGMVLAHIITVADAARQLGVPVKLYVSRKDFFTVGAFRAASTQRVRLAGKGGKLTALAHDNTGQTCRFDTFVNAGTEQTARMYDFQAIRTQEKVVRLDTNTPGFMRAPAEMQTLFALESGVDELAYELGVDPLELRLASDDPTKEPVEGLPWTSRSLAQCLRRGAELFGWSERPAEVGTLMRDGLKVGYGVASSIYPTAVNAATAEIKLGSDLSCRVTAAGCDLGTGAYTVFQQLVASELGLPLANIQVELGNSDFPTNGVAGGSAQTASVGSAILNACRQVRAQLAKQVSAQGGALEGSDPKQLVFENATLRSEQGSVPLQKVFEAVPFGVIQARGAWQPATVDPASSSAFYLSNGGSTYRVFIAGGRVMAAFGAQFAEVTVDPLTGEVRVPRVVGVFAAGRIMNKRTAHSQLMGGMIWGVGSALHEVTEVDPRYARFLNTNLGEYLIVVNADVPSVTAEMIEEVDEYINPLGVKGLGEIGNVGTAAAIANAVYHATGKRVRDLPIRMEKVL